ncbi:MAG: hypothetical protein WCF67_07670 [Chitinophagaceae bacterium]
MNQQQQMEERLWSYIDGVCEADEQSAVEQLLQSNAEWQSKYRELLDVHQLLDASELEEPSMRFTRNVMEEIARLQIAPATRSYINKSIIYSIGGFFVIMILGFITYGLSQIDWSASGSTTMPVDLGKVNYNVFFNNTYVNIFMMINVVLGLVLLDRYLSNKKKKIA